MFATVQDIRERAGFLNFSINKTMYPVLTPASQNWYIKSNDLEKFVVRSYSGATVPSTADVQVLYDGASVGYDSFDIATGRITMSTGYVSGASLVVTSASSPIQSQKVLDYGKQAHGEVLSYIGRRYSLPLGVSVPMLVEYEARLAAARLLIDSYGVSGQNSAEDGYKMEELVLERLKAIGSGSLALIDSDGNEVPSDPSGTTGGGNALSTGSRVRGYLFTADQEEFDVIDPDDI